MTRMAMCSLGLQTNLKITEHNLSCDILTHQVFMDEVPNKYLVFIIIELHYKVLL